MQLFRGSFGDKISSRILQFTLLLTSILVSFSTISAADAYKIAQQGGGSQVSTVHHVFRYFNRSIPVHSLPEIPHHSQCTLVHNATDQCTWILENCNDQDSGLFSYLELYYCRLPQAKPVAMIIILLWLATLFSTIGITASDYFCINLSTISTVLGLSESVAGVTLLAFGNGSPDVFSTWAAMSTNSGSLAIGELIGAAGFITGVVAGTMAIVRPFKVSKMSFIRDLGFFIVATGFSFGFLVDGHLALWECIVMVGFYLFYVSVVIICHWRSRKKKKKNMRDKLARQHFLNPEYTDIPANEADDEDTMVGVSRNHRTEDEFDRLERSEAINFDEDEVDDETRERHMAEIKTKMRIRRPRGVSRENSRNPIRPSLIGALEFRNVLSSLERSRSHLSIPLYMRRYSEDAVTSFEQQNRLKRANSDIDPIAIPPSNSMDQGPYQDEPASARPRAVSTNALDLKTPGLMPPGARLPMMNESFNDRQHDLLRLSIPTYEDTRSPSGSYNRGSSALLTPASAERTPRSLSPVSPTDVDSRIPSHRAARSLDVPGPTGPSAARSQDGSPEGSYFSTYHDDPGRGRRSRASSFLLPPPIMQDDDANDQESSLISWWPYKFLPAPDELFSTLMPTLCDFSKKGWPQKILAVLIVPSVFLLTITLPVVESSGDDKDEKLDKTGKISRNNTNQDDLHISNSNTPLIRTEDENGRAHPSTMTTISSDIQTNLSPSKDTSGWNRWLLCIQLLVAPQFVISIIWANIDDDHDTRSLLLCLTIGTIISLLTLLALLLTTTEKKPPSWRPLFCILGFIVSISWISTIANEVVGILKALGIILNISEAILGLTVFAIGSR